MKFHADRYTQQEITEIYYRNIGTVYRLAYLYLKNPADAEDAAQSVFLKMIRSGHRFDSIQHEKAWCISVTKNHCRDLLKSFWRTRRADLERLPEAADETPPEEGVLLEMILTMPGKYKEVLYLYHYEGYSVRELASILNQKESTLQTRLATGRKMLKKNFEEGNR